MHPSGKFLTQRAVRISRPIAHCSFDFWLCAGPHAWGRNQVPAGLTGGDSEENHVPSGRNGGDVICENEGVGCDGRSSSVSQISAHLSETSPATEPPELEHARELPIEVLSGLLKSVDLKCPKSVDVNLELYSNAPSVCAR